jgi:hypothetical protein
MIETKERLEAAETAGAAQREPHFRRLRSGRKAWITSALATLLAGGIAVTLVVATNGGSAPARHGSAAASGDHVTSMRPFSDPAFVPAEG